MYKNTPGGNKLHQITFKLFLNLSSLRLFHHHHHHHHLQQHGSWFKSCRVASLYCLNIFMQFLEAFLLFPQFYED